MRPCCESLDAETLTVIKTQTLIEFARILLDIIPFGKLAQQTNAPLPKAPR